MHCACATGHNEQRIDERATIIHRYHTDMYRYRFIYIFIYTIVVQPKIGDATITKTKHFQVSYREKRHIIPIHIYIYIYFISNSNNKNDMLHIHLSIQKRFHLSKCPEREKSFVYMSRTPFSRDIFAMNYMFSDNIYIYIYIYIYIICYNAAILEIYSTFV
jgi:hypothetical protein